MKAYFRDERVANALKGESRDPGLLDLILVPDHLDGPVGEKAATQVHAHADQGDQGHNQADIIDANPHVAVDHPVVSDLDWRPISSSVWGSTHGQGRRSVGQELNQSSWVARRGMVTPAVLGYDTPRRPVKTAPPKTVKTSPMLELSR